MYEDRPVGEKIKYFYLMSKKGSKDKNGKELSDFKRGIYFGKGEMLSYCVRTITKYKKNLRKEFEKKCKGPNLNMNERTYTDAEINKLFTNLDDESIFTDKVGDI